jgi:hypothetical protein
LRSQEKSRPSRIAKISFTPPEAKNRGAYQIHGLALNHGCQTASPFAKSPAKKG